MAINRFPQRKILRLKKYDYSKPGYYFVTLCTKDRQCLFGDVVNRQMILSKAGKIIDQWWREIPKRFEGSSRPTLGYNHFKWNEDIENPKNKLGDKKYYEKLFE